MIDRRFRGPKYTISSLTIDGRYLCDVLEDPVRIFGPRGEGKIKGNTAIPAGIYRVIRTMSPRFKRILPLLLDVPFFDGIRIHPGNTAADTEGCILPGLNKVVGKVIDSRIWFGELGACEYIRIVYWVNLPKWTIERHRDHHESHQRW